MKKILVATLVGLSLVACSKSDKKSGAKTEAETSIDYATAKTRADKDGKPVTKEKQLIGDWMNADKQATSQFKFKGTGEAVYLVLEKTSYDPEKGEVKTYSGPHLRFSVPSSGVLELVHPGNQIETLKVRLLEETEEHPELLIVGEGEDAELYYRTLVQEH